MRDRPHPNHKLEWPGGVVPEWARPKKNPNKRFGKKGAKGAKGGGKRERLQKVMAQSGYGSRRNIEILIAQGHLTINGEPAKLGDQVGPGDKVKLDGNVIHLRFGAQMPRVLMYHKPDNEIVTRDDPEGRATVFEKLPKVTNGRWVSVGRLDLNTSGLLLFTTNGDLANKLTHPRFEVEREYAVRVMGEIDEDKREKLLKAGVDIDGELCTFDSLEDRGGEGSNHWYHVVLREGKNREVRRMMEAVGLMVSRLMRVRFGCVQLPGFLKRGMLREMDEDQVSELLAFAGMNEPEPGEEGDDEEEAEEDNIGNRFDPVRDAKPQRPEPEDDIGNRYDPAREARNKPREIDDDIGNRGTYGQGYKEPKEKAPRRPGGGGGSGGKGFFKKRGPVNDNIGNVAGPAHRHREVEGNYAPGNGAPPAARHADGNGPQGGQGQPGQGRNKRRNKRGKGQGGAQPQGGPPQGQGQQQRAQGGPPPGQPGQGKPNRNRRNRNRNRNRGAGAPQGQPPAAGGGES